MSTSAASKNQANAELQTKAYDAAAASDAAAGEGGAGFGGGHGGEPRYPKRNSKLEEKAVDLLADLLIVHLGDDFKNDVGDDCLALLKIHLAAVRSTVPIAPQPELAALMRANMKTLMDDGTVKACTVCPGNSCMRWTMGVRNWLTWSATRDAANTANSDLLSGPHIERGAYFHVAHDLGHGDYTPVLTAQGTVTYSS